MSLMSSVFVSEVHYFSSSRHPTCCGLEVACSVVALREEDVVVGAALQWLVEGNGLAHKLLLDLAEAVETRLELEVVVGVCLSDSRDNGDVVTLGADVVGRRDDSNVDV
jgi:hypothetical protein